MSDATRTFGALAGDEEVLYVTEYEAALLRREPQFFPKDDYALNSKGTVRFYEGEIGVYLGHIVVQVRTS